MTVIKFRPKNAPSTPREEINDIDATIHQMRKDDAKQRIKFGAIVVLFGIAAVLSVALGMGIAATFGNEYMNDRGESSSVPSVNVP